MEPLIYDPKTKPMRYAGCLSFLQKFIFVPNQSNQVQRLRLLIFTTCLIMALAIGILFYTDNLIMSRTPIGRAGTEFWPASKELERQGGHLDERESTPSQVTIPRHGGRLDERESTAAQVSLLNILGPNQSDPVWQLSLLAALSLVVHATMGVLLLPGDLQVVHATYQRVMLIMGFGVPIVVAVITLLVSIWLVPDPSGRSNWITGLSVANFSLLGGRLVVYWTIKRGTDKNILIGEEIELMREVI